MIPKPIDRHMREALSEAIEVIFPLRSNAATLIQRHVWRNPDYVGEFEGQVAAWRGWSANLARVDSAYQGVYIDYVKNFLPIDHRLRLFGEVFTSVIGRLDSYVVAYVTHIPPEAASLVAGTGLIIREIGRKAHACILSSPTTFLKHSTIYWGARIAKMINVRHELLAYPDIVHRELNDISALAERWDNEVAWEDDLNLLDV